MVPTRLALLPCLALLLAGCSSAQTAGGAVCGDGVVQAGEACDDPADPTCRPDCTRTRCGDGIRDPGEQCDDPGSPDCRADCTVNPCGDGVPDPGEECDDPFDPACRDDCTLIRCGDGIRDPGEECDDPSDPGCREDCTAVRCGDGIRDPGEECDAPRSSNCREDCTAVRCGDGIRDPGEECDDGNGDPDDGCVACRVWPPADCRPGEECGILEDRRYLCVDPDDDGPAPGRCVPVARTGEFCDPARAVLTCPAGETCLPVDGCVQPLPWNCHSSCGDGALDPGEACEPAVHGVCGPACTAPVASCADPADLSGFWDSWEGTVSWRSDGPAGPGGAFARFEAPHEGNYLFRLEPLDVAAALSLYPADGCGDPARELARVSGFPGERVALARFLAARETVVLGLEVPTGAPFRVTVDARYGTCGDGSVDDWSEECDDGNSTTGDGCSEICVVEWAEGEACGTSPFTAYLAGKLLPSDGDDTAPSCLPDGGAVDASVRFVAPEAGRYEFRALLDRGPGSLSLRDEVCGAVEHECTPVAGGNSRGFLVRELGENEAVAVVVDGPAGARFTLEVNRISCGDGRTAASEECDGEGYCLADCRIGPGEREPNDTPDRAELLDDAPRRAFLASAADVDTWMVRSGSGVGEYEVRRIHLGLGTPNGCIAPGPGHDFLRLRLVDRDGQLLAEVRSPGPGSCPVLTHRASPGEVAYVQVVRGADAGGGPVGPYFLQRRF
jgi:cysteine-rich repeat protein